MKSIIYLNLFPTEMLGNIGISVTEYGLLRLRMFQENKEAYLRLNLDYQEGDYIYSDQETKHVLDQIQAYLSYDIREFMISIDWAGYTDFQKAVLKKTLAIHYGETKSYGEIAAEVGSPKAFRAVGQAEKRNEVPLVIPCHRVIGSDGSLTGYGGKDNTHIKAQLLDFEKIGKKQGKV